MFEYDGFATVLGSHLSNCTIITTQSSETDDIRIVVSLESCLHMRHGVLLGHDRNSCKVQTLTLLPQPVQGCVPPRRIQRL